MDWEYDDFSDTVDVVFDSDEEYLNRKSEIEDLVYFIPEWVDVVDLDIQAFAGDDGEVLVTVRPFREH